MRDGSLNVRPERMRAQSGGEAEGGLGLARVFSTAGRERATASARGYEGYSARPRSRKAGTQIGFFKRHILLPLMATMRRDPVWGFVMSGGVILSLAIAANALFLQRSGAPFPHWSTSLRGTELPVPDPSPLMNTASLKPETAHARGRAREVITRELQLELARRGFYEGSADGVWGASTDAALHDMAFVAKIQSPMEPTEALLAEIKASPVTVHDQASKLLTKPAAAVPVPSSKPRAAQAPAAAQPMQITPPLSSEKRIASVQRALNRLGYGPLTVDGKMGSGTRQALLNFERKRALPATGDLTNRTVRELAAAAKVTIEN